MNVTLHEKPKAPISAEEMERRREVVRRADACSRIEGLYRSAKAAPIFESFIRGEIDLHEIIPRLNQLYGRSPA